jgi:hypothetical protein
MLREKLIGAWMLESYAEYPSDRSAPSHPLGEDAEGIIIYSPDGYMSAQVMRVGRPAFASGDWLRGTPDEYREAAGYIAYSGRFHVDEEKRALTHNMFVSFYPNWLGQTQLRAVELNDDVLILRPHVPIASAGKMVVPRIQWRRAPRAG